MTKLGEFKVPDHVVLGALGDRNMLTIGQVILSRRSVPLWFAFPVPYVLSAIAYDSAVAMLLGGISAW